MREDDKGSFHIRPAGPDEAAAVAVAAIHCESWRSAYRGILPDVYLDHEAPAERLQYWTAKLSAPNKGGFVLLAMNGGDPVGFVAVSRPGEPGYDADIDSLHVDPARRGGGVGRRLLGAAAARLLDDGASSACLRVYDANEAAARFYLRLGGVAHATGIDPFAGADMPDTRYGWRDLAALAAACASTPA